MASTLTVVRKIWAALHSALCISFGAIPWTKAQIESEIVAVDAFCDTNDTTINQAFSAGFRAQSSVADRALIYICIVIARRLVQSPEHLAVLRNILNRIV